MGPPENSTKSREAKVKVKTEPENTHTQQRRKEPAFASGPKFAGAYRSLTGLKFSGHRTNDFNDTLDSIVIYVGDIYDHEMEITLMEQK